MQPGASTSTVKGRVGIGSLVTGHSSLIATIAKMLSCAVPVVSLVFASSAQAGFLGIEFDEDDCIDKYSEQMRWPKQRKFMSDICRLKHSDNSRIEKRFAQCVLDSIFEISDDSNGKRVVQSCSSKVGDEASYRRYVGRFSMQQDPSEIIRKMQDQSESQIKRPIVIIDSDGKTRLCIRLGEIIDCP